jgi:hypothetical protein
MKYIVGLCLIALSGCAFNTLNEGLPQLVGSPIDRAVDALGLPNQKLEIGAYNVYVWDNRFSSTVPIYNTNTSRTTGNIGNVPVSGTTTTSSVNYIPVQYQCQIKLQVDSDEIVRRWEWAGNQGGCQYYANGLKRIIPKK